MENKRHPIRGFPAPDKQLIQHTSSNSLSIQLKQTESDPQSEKHQKALQLSLKSSKPETRVLKSQANPIKTQSRALIIQDFSLKSPSSSKPVHRRASSTDQKREKANFPISSRKKYEKPTDCILKVAEQMSIKKLNELYRISSIGDSFICRSLLALIAEVDYHIGSCQEFSIEMFFEYISTPGIVVQTIKRIPDLVLNDRIPAGMDYLESYSQAIELFNQAKMISKFPGINIIAALLKTVFEYKNLAFENLEIVGEAEKDIKEKMKTPEKLKNFEKVEVKEKIKEKTRPSHRRTVQSADLSNKALPSISILPPEDPPYQYIPYKTPCKAGEEFMQSKSMLLQKFFSKMGLQQSQIIEREKSPAKDYLNRSIEMDFSNLDSGNYIKAKSGKRPKSVTPVSSSRARTLNETKSSNTLNKEKIEDIKKTQFLLGSRFYKKIDHKFIETLVEKMKRESMELKRLKKSNFDEYKKKKNQFIASNKDKWVVDTIRYLETSELLVPNNENDLGQEAKHDAVLAYLSNEQLVASLVRRAEQMEISFRRGANK